MDTEKLYLNLTLEAIRAEQASRLPGIESEPPEVQAERCIAWIRANCLILDPSSFRPIPFDLYPYQEEFIRVFMAEVAKARRGEPAGIRIEKSRQMGDSWLLMAIELYLLRFYKNFQALNISRKEQKVDDGGQHSTPDSLHGKIRYMYERLPAEQSFALEIRHLSLVNRVTGGTILGEAANPHAGRGGTFLFGLWDETASTEHSMSIQAAFVQAVRCPCYLSTPLGKSNLFARLRESRSLRQIRHHWTDHPLKGRDKYQCPGGVVHPGHTDPCQGGEWRSPWYDDQCQLLAPEQVAQELDISYERSIAGRAFPEFDAARHGFAQLDVESGGVFVASIDPGVSQAAGVLLQFVDVPGVRECRVMESWTGPDATAQTYARLLTSWQGQYGKLLITGDPTGQNRGLVNGQSVFGELNQRYGLHVVVLPHMRNVVDRVRLTRDFMAERDIGHGRTGRFAYRRDLEEFARSLEEAKWPTDPDGRVTKETDLEHNEAEHTADALSYGIAFYCHRSSACLPPNSPPRCRPLTAGMLNMQF